MAYSHRRRGREKTVLSCRVGGVNKPLEFQFDRACFRVRELSPTFGKKVE